MAHLDSRQLTCFIAVAEEGHMGRAAARLHMTQPPLTRRIGRLEREVGVELFARTSSGMELTEAGAVLLGRARQILKLSDHAVDRARLAGEGRVGRLVVGYYGSTIYESVPRVLREFLNEHPAVDVVLERTPKDEQAVAIRDGRMTIGFSRYHRAEPGLRVRTVAEEPVYAALHQGNRLLDQAELKVSDLRDEPLVLFPATPRPSFADEVVLMCKNAGFVPEVWRECQDVTTALAYVATGRACCVVPRAATHLLLPGVQFALLSDAPAQPTSCLFRDGDHNPLLRRLLATFARADGPSV